MYFICILHILINILKHIILIYLKQHFHVSKNNSKSNKMIKILVLDSSSLNMTMSLDNTSNNTR